MTHFLAFAALAAHMPDPKIEDVFQRSFRDAYFVATIDMAKQSELVKIRKEFGTQYRFKETKVWLKEPHKIRLEAKVDDTLVIYLINGTKKQFKVPRVNMSQVEDVADAPGKRQTFLDFGIMTSTMFSDPFSSDFIRVDRQSGELVFDIIFKKRYEYNTRHRVWIDAAKKYTTKREWFAQEGFQLATFFYTDPINLGGVWFPTKCTVKNVEGKVAGITSYKKVAINAGIAESLFEIK